jgi:predicted small secreted protein
MKRFAAVFLVAAAATLAGCSTTRLVDSDVQSFSSLPSIPAGATYRFERLPSQETMPVQQNMLEAVAQQSLERVGLKHDEAAATYSVQVGLQAQRRVEYDPFGPGFGPGFGGYGGFGPGFRRGGFYGGYGGYYGYPYGRFPDRVIYAQQVGLTVRDIASGRIVYETHAAHDSLYPADTQVLTVMLDSALYGFPQAPAGIRRVNVEIPKVSSAR